MKFVQKCLDFRFRIISFFNGFQLFLGVMLFVYMLLLLETNGTFVYFENFKLHNDIVFYITVINYITKYKNQKKIAKKELIIKNFV